MSDDVTRIALVNLGERPSGEAQCTSPPAMPKDSASQRMRVSFCLPALLFLILPNLPLLLSTRSLGTLPHGYVNLEYLFIGAVGVMLPRGVVFALLVMEFVADFVYAICYTYQFSVGDLLLSLRYLGAMPVGRMMQGAALLGMVVLICITLALLRSLPQNRVWTFGALLIFIAILTPIDMLGGQNPFWQKDVAALSCRVTRSPALTLLVRELRAYCTDVRSRAAVNAPMRSASSRAVSLLQARPNSARSPNVVLIVVESWGLLQDAQLAQAITVPFDDPRIAQRYLVSSGGVPFTGLTVPGEARELCHSTAGFGIIHPNAEQDKRCLPGFFNARGYESFAVHGYVGQMFYRSSWYSTLGFDHTWFEADLKTAGLASCHGAFPGICDSSIAAWIGESLLTGDKVKPRFIYWVTLNSHVPVPAHPDLPDDGVCATSSELRNSAALCSWFQIERAVQQSVQKVALQTTYRPTVFILVGDHAPPFSDAQLRNDFSSTMVPYLMLTPKSLSH